ncbi:MAG: hypothetical protein AB1410_08090 [Acidobacteriota bacterium]
MQERIILNLMKNTKVHLLFQGTFLWSFNDKLYEIVTVPFSTQFRFAVGLIIGFLINNQTTIELKSMINSEIIFFLNGKIVATSLTESESLDNFNFIEKRSDNNPIEI